MGSYPRSSDVSPSSDSQGWRVRVFAYPDGSCEGVLTPVRQPGTRLTPQEKAHRMAATMTDAQLAAVSLVGLDAVLEQMTLDQEADDQEKRRQANEERAIQRARVSVRRAVRAHGLRRLLTFTNGSQGDGWTGRKEALDDVARFLMVHGARLLHGRPAVLIAERGGRNGRWHVHAAIPGGYRIHYAKAIRQWSAFMERRGWHSPTGTHRWHAGDEASRHKGDFSSSRILARYLVKYMVKGFQDDAGTPGEHRYRLYGCNTPQAWTCTVGSVLAARVLLTLGVEDIHARFSPQPGGDRFRCYQFDEDGMEPPPSWLDGADVRSLYFSLPQYGYQEIAIQRGVAV